MAMFKYLNVISEEKRWRKAIDTDDERDGEIEQERKDKDII